MKPKENLQDEEQVKSLFGRVRDSSLVAPAMLRTRVVSRLSLERIQKRKLLLWQALSFFATSACAVLAVVFFNLQGHNNPPALTKQAYVIHVDFDQNDQKRIARAEVELPDDVFFVSSKMDLATSRKMNLPIQISSVGRSKLPFVVASSAVGDKEIKVRLLDANDNLVREQVLKFKFAKQENSTIF